MISLNYAKIKWIKTYCLRSKRKHESQLVFPSRIIYNTRLLLSIATVLDEGGRPADAFKQGSFVKMWKTEKPLMGGQVRPVRVLAQISAHVFINIPRIRDVE